MSYQKKKEFRYKYTRLSSNPSLKPGTKAYARAVYEQFGKIMPQDLLIPDRNGRIPLSQYDDQYFAAVDEYNRIISGEWVAEKNLQYKENYTKAIEQAGIDEVLLEEIKAMPVSTFIKMSPHLPSIKDMYIPKRYGNKTIRESITSMEEGIYDAVNLVRKNKEWYDNRKKVVKKRKKPNWNFIQEYEDEQGW